MPSSRTQTPAAKPIFVNSDGLAEALNVSKRQVAELRKADWFPLAIELGPRTLRWDLNEVMAAMQRHARRTRIGAEPAQLANGRDGKRAEG